MIVKICGLTTPVDAEMSLAAGADLLGFVFAAGSRRALRQAACGWIKALRGGAKVGVFRDQPLALVQTLRDAAGLDLVQLHGGETPEECAALGGRDHVVKAIAVSGALDWRVVAAYAEVARILFDTAGAAGGGTGLAFDWSAVTSRPVARDCLLAGGLAPENVGAAIVAVRPAGVDVATGVEVEPGRKDPEKVRRFVRAARAAAAQEPL